MDVIGNTETVELNVTANEPLSYSIWKRFPRSMSVFDFRQRLEIMTGRNSKTMRITVMKGDGQVVGHLKDDDKPIGMFVEDGAVLLVDDPKFTVDNEENIDKRYQLSDDQYASRKGTLKDFLSRNRLGKYDPTFISQAEADEEKRRLIEEGEKKLLESITIGDRCEVTIPRQGDKRGVVMFKGTVKFASGHWVGVRYDEPFGKNDGSVAGVRYFEAPDNYGVFVKPMYVRTGDYPELETGLECEDEF